MAYDETLAARVRQAVAARATYVEVRMFGGLTFMVNTHLAVGVLGSRLLVRLPAIPDALERGAEPVTMGARTMSGMAGVSSELLAGDALEAWVRPGVVHALMLPPKSQAASEQP